jgi:hypothetical protein
MYLGNQPALSYTSFAKQDFTTSATTSYTLDNPVANENEIALFINFVRQEPTTAYTASGTSLTLTSATSASDDMYCVFLGKAVQTVNPPNGSVGLSQLSATGTKDSTTFLRGDNTFASAGGANTPAFEAKLSSSQSLSDATAAKIQFDTEVFDTDNCYDNSTNYRFTPNVAGKYVVYAILQLYGNGTSEIENCSTDFYKNGSLLLRTWNDFRTNYLSWVTYTQSKIIEFNGSSDYVEIYGYINSVSGTVSVETDATRTSYFGAYKIIE